MTRNGMFGGTISGGRRCCVDRDRRRIGVHDGLWTHVRPGYRMLVCRERRYSGGESLVAMMETADFRQRYDLAHGGRLDGAGFRRVLPQGQVRSRTVIVTITRMRSEAAQATPYALGRRILARAVCVQTTSSVIA